MMIKGVICIKTGIKDYGYFLFMVKKFMYENQDLELMNIIDGINIVGFIQAVLEITDFSEAEITLHIVFCRFSCTARCAG